MSWERIHVQPQYFVYVRSLIGFESNYLLFSFDQEIKVHSVGVGINWSWPINVPGTGRPILGFYYRVHARLNNWNLKGGEKTRLPASSPGHHINAPGSDFFPSRIRTVSIPDPGSSSKNLRILTPKKAKKWFLSSKALKLSHPGSRIQGSKRHPIPDPGSATLQKLQFTICRPP